VHEKVDCGAEENFNVVFYLMKASAEHIELFDSYLQGVMAEAELREFEARLQYDTEFAELFEAYKKLETDIRGHYQREALKQGFEAIDKELDTESKPRNSSMPFIWIASAVAATAVLAFFVISFFKQPDSPVKLAQKHWPAEAGLPVRMSTKAPFDDAMNAFKQQKWEESIQLLTQRTPSDTAFYFLGVVHFMQNDFEAAINSFEQVPASSHWYFQSEYRKTLVFLAKGDIEIAKTHFQEISLSESPHKSQSAAILKEF
jgi:tetratricopeptide (TPR) repeat protein